MCFIVFLKRFHFLPPHDWACLLASDCSKYYLRFSHSIRNSNTLFQEGPSLLRLELLPPQAAEHLPAIFLAVSQPQSLFPISPFFAKPAFPPPPPQSILSRLRPNVHHILYVLPVSDPPGFPSTPVFSPAPAHWLFPPSFAPGSSFLPPSFCPMFCIPAPAKTQQSVPVLGAGAIPPPCFTEAMTGKVSSQSRRRHRPPREAETIPGRPRATRDDGQRRQSCQPGGTPAEHLRPPFCQDRPAHPLTPRRHPLQCSAAPAPPT